MYEQFFLAFPLIIFVVLLAIITILYKTYKKTKQQISILDEQLSIQNQRLQSELKEYMYAQQYNIMEKISTSQVSTQQLIHDTIQKQMIDTREQIGHSFKQHASSLTAHLQTLTEEIRAQLHSLTHQVNHKLAEGFEKTSSTFTDIVKRLTIIDEAQKKISELSSNVVSLQDVLLDKRSRGAFGEVQLQTLIANMIPSGHYQMQYTLSNQKRVDCILFLPEPSGNICIDAKFPLETYQKILSETAAADKKILQQQFKQDLQKHIKDIAERYIISNETADSAMMFIPAEAIFAEIHANYPDIITLSQKLKVWLVSPTTLMAVLTTAKAVIKDDATRKQVHIIQKHLHDLSGDFSRFEKRMDNLSKHIDKAHKDVSEVNTSAKKISQRFQKIEAVELPDEEDVILVE